MDEEIDRLRAVDDEAGGSQAEPVPAYQEPKTRLPWIGLAVLLVVVGLLVWRFVLRSPDSQPTVERTPVAESRAAPGMATVETLRTGLGIGDPDPALPPIDGLDAYLRPLLAALSARPELASLLASDDLIRRFVVSVDAVARGDSPASQVRAIAPKGAFAVRQRGTAYAIDPASYARYDGLVALVADLDPDRLARIYGQIKPRLEEAHAELGTGTTLDEAMTRALTRLVRTPLPPTGAAVRQGKGISYVYVDPTLEELTLAERHLLRLGPERMARVQAKLRAFAAALGAGGL
ncbi:MAG: DUF3014 domain-containing protein [Acidobacteria bacterium]|nr:DUF3014 domain-containing protein [Acidobacteriota bacterium]